MFFFICSSWAFVFTWRGWGGGIGAAFSSSQNTLDLILRWRDSLVKAKCEIKGQGGFSTVGICRWLLHRAAASANRSESTSSALLWLLLLFWIAKVTRLCGRRQRRRCELAICILTTEMLLNPTHGPLICHCHSAPGCWNSPKSGQLYAWSNISKNKSIHLKPPLV